LSLLRELRARIETATASLFSALRRTLDLRDIFWIGGLSAVGYGIAQIHAPAAWIVCGAAVFWMGVRR